MLSVAGVAAIALSALMFRSNMPYLEVAMLLPCLGASGIILAGSKTTVARFLDSADRLKCRHDFLFSLSLPLADHFLFSFHLRRRG